MIAAQLFRSFNKYDALRIGDALRGNTQVNRLQIVMTHLGDDDDEDEDEEEEHRFNPKIRWIETSPSLVACDLDDITTHGRHSRPELLHRIFLAMAGNAKLERVNLSGMGVYVDGFTTLMHQTNSLQKLALDFKLSFQHCRFDAEATRLFINMLKCSTPVRRSSVRYLRLGSHNRLADPMGQVVSRILEPRVDECHRLRRYKNSKSEPNPMGCQRLIWHSSSRA